MIKPTVGRIVWYHRGPRDWVNQRDQPLAAIITYVQTDTMVHLVVFEAEGRMEPRLNVELCQGDTAPSEREHCEWMPYQKGQAAKTEALEQKLSDKAP